jgi:hypothetical protein
MLFQVVPCLHLQPLRKCINFLSGKSFIIVLCVWFGFVSNKFQSAVCKQEDQRSMRDSKNKEKRRETRQHCGLWFQL